jgi:hypothetical protein
MDKIYLKDNYIVTELSGVTAVFGKNYTVYSENTTTFFLNSSFPINNARSVTIDFSRSSTIFNEAGTVAYTTATLRAFFLANTGFKSPVGGSTGITVGTTPITSGVDGRVLFQSGGVVSQDSGFFWDNTNKRLGVGTSAPSDAIEVLGYNKFIRVHGASNDRSIWIGSRSDGSGDLYLFNGSNSNTALITGNGTSFINGGNLVIGAAAAGARLDVRAQGALSTDIAFRVRNSADNLNTFSHAGNGDTIIRSTGLRLSVQFRYNEAGNDRTAFSFVNNGANSGSINWTFDSTYSGANVQGLKIYDSNSGDNQSIFTIRRNNFFFGGDNFGATINDRKVLYIPNGTAPTTSVIDTFKFYSADIIAGNAAPHFRTENGAVIKLYQVTTGIAAAAFVSNTSLIVNDSATYGGYTMGQVVAALKAQGLLA